MGNTWPFLSINVLIDEYQTLVFNKIKLSFELQIYKKCSLE